MDPEPGKKPQRFIVLMHVRGDSIRMVEIGDAFHGRGRLYGRSGEWNRWKTVSYLPDGSRLVSEDEIRKGRLKVKKRHYGPDGKLTVSMQEDFPEIDKTRYLEELSRYTR